MQQQMEKMSIRRQDQQLHSDEQIKSRFCFPVNEKEKLLFSMTLMTDTELAPYQ